MKTGDGRLDEGIKRALKSFSTIKIQTNDSHGGAHKKPLKDTESVESQMHWLLRIGP